MTLRSTSALLATVLLGLAFTGPNSVANADDNNAVLKDRRIAYVTTALHWAHYQTKNLNADCPQGLNGYGPRETFKALYPNGGTVEGTQLAREALRAFPQDAKPKFPYILAKGKIALGLNLDGKVGPNDFTSPEGEKGIDNNLYKVLGCNANFRSPEGQLQLFAGEKEVRDSTYGRTMIELTNVDSLVDDDDVDVTIYRGRDPLLLDASGDKIAAGGTQRIDVKYGKPFIQHLHGKIVGGVLITEPIKDGLWPWSIYNEAPADLKIHDMRFRMKLTPSSADGLLAGYTDVESWYHWVTGWSSHHLAYGQLDPAEFYWALHDNADAYPDQDGHNTAISSAITVNMAQVYIIHPDEKVAEGNGGRTATASAR
jgi:hypothetical protein